MVSDVNFSTALNQQQNTAASTAALAEDFTQFLTLLTVQLQNQDPLEPTDTNELTNQIVAFTGVEQQINTNQKLDSLVALQLGGALSSAQNYVGLDINYVSSEFSFDGDSATIQYSMPSDATEANINVMNEEGQVIYTTEASKIRGAHDFVWDGRLNGGGLAGPGMYQIRVDALDADEQPIQSTTIVSGTVRGAESQNGQIFLLVGERAVALNSVLNTNSTQDTNVSDAMTLALRYIGMDVNYDSNEFIFNGNPVNLNYSLPEDASRAKLLVYDDRGNVVDSEDVPRNAGSHTFAWDGILSDGSTAPTAEYTYVIDAIAPNSTSIKNTSNQFNGSDTIVTTYSLDANADNVRATVVDSNGQTVYQTNVPNDAGGHSFEWDGQTSNGATAAAGQYTIDISIISNTDRHITATTSAFGTVQGVETLNGQIFLDVDGQTIPLNQVSSVRTAASNNNNGTS